MDSPRALGIDPATLRSGDEVLVIARVERTVPPDAPDGDVLVVLSIEHGLPTHGRTDQTTQVVVSPTRLAQA